MIFPTLTAEQIEVKVKKVTAKGAVAVLYKTARVDMDLLDDVAGNWNWQCKYEDIKGVLYCHIGIKDENEWIWKCDCGIESRDDGEGTQVKGEASDAFKRAGFRWGIGRELYTSPFVFLNVATKQDGNKYKLENPFEQFAVTRIAYDDHRRITDLFITGKNGVVYSLRRKGNTPIEPVPDNLLTKAQMSLLGEMVMVDGQKDLERQDWLNQTNAGYGYGSSKEIQQKDFQKIHDAFEIMIKTGGKG